MQPSPGRLDHLTFKGNLRQTRYGWLRLTPAYSVHLVAGLVDAHWTPGTVILDPFCGTGTTALVCAERGIRCDTTDINPFLLWLTQAKTASYTAAHLSRCREQAGLVHQAIRRAGGRAPWTPPLHQIDKWWSPHTLAALGRAMGAIRRIEQGKASHPSVVNLLKVAFCRMMIDHAKVSFGHQSMSFKRQPSDAPRLVAGDADSVAKSWDRAVGGIADAAASVIVERPSAIPCDARDLCRELPLDHYGCVITSPPYPNRMSYIRELRPYMYWLGYLSDGRQAGELDWQAIGGTWGCATSRVATWAPHAPVTIPFPGLQQMIARVAERSDILARYIAKYFHDMMNHCESLFAVVKPGGTIHYIVGNSKFYDVLLPVEHIFAAMFEAAGFTALNLETIRKRTSKKELFELVVSGRKPARRSRRTGPRLPRGIPAPGG